MKMWYLLTLLFILPCTAFNQGNPINDGSWSAKKLVLLNTPEADAMIRVGDIDNLNFGFPEGFNPFCGVTTEVHWYPWTVDESDPPGTDRILVGSGHGRVSEPCGSDGYTYSNSRPDNLPVPIVLPLDKVKAMEIQSALLQLFVDDFQSPVFCGKFQMTINGKRFTNGEMVLNALEQTGPVGKLISIPLPEDFLPLLKDDHLKVLIDDPTSGAGDGFAFDFVKLLVNYRPQFTCIGNLKGVVIDMETWEPISSADVEIAGFGSAVTDNQGRFSLSKIPAGLQIIFAGKAGYERGSVSKDIEENMTSEVEIYLKRSSKSASFAGKVIKEGESVVINNILFDQGSARLRPESLAELDKIVLFLQSNPQSQIELSGHTSSEGGRTMNVSLSYQRVASCRDFLLTRGIDPGRIVVVGYGPDRPIADNATETGRSLNRRVEMRILKL